MCSVYTYFDILQCMVMISTLKEQIHAEVKLLYRLQNCPEICLNGMYVQNIFIAKKYGRSFSHGLDISSLYLLV